MRNTLPPMSGEPEISVVVATRDRASRLTELLRSLRAQTVGKDDFEVIVVDDASVDATPTVVAREIERGELKLQVVRRDLSGGPGAARNAGWPTARASLVAFIDDDCVAAPRWLEAGLAASSEHPGRFVQGRTDPNPA
jgi:glycosyltransferase involved in cell wall biosynthesis